MSFPDTPWTHPLRFQILRYRAMGAVGAAAGFAAGFACAAVAALAILAAYVYYVHVLPLTRGAPSALADRDVLPAEQEPLWAEKAAPEEAYHCGWVVVTTTYGAEAPAGLSALQRPGGKRLPGVFFCVLKNGALFLFPSESQDAPVGVHSIRGASVDVWPRGAPRDEVFRKDSPLRIGVAGSPSLFLYAARATEKEDWLAALRTAAGSPPGVPRAAVEAYMRRLVDASPRDAPLAWLNALAGRVFLNVFRSAATVDLLRARIERRLAAAPRSLFLGPLVLRDVSPGDALPVLSNARLHSLSASGELSMGVDVEYGGGFGVRVATEVHLAGTDGAPGARASWLSSALSVVRAAALPAGAALSVPVELGVRVRRLAGRLELRIKAPPSDRLWLGFHGMPAVELDVAPLVLHATQRVSWSVVHAAVMRGVRDALLEFAVLPNMEDVALPPMAFGPADLSVHVPAGIPHASPDADVARFERVGAEDLRMAHVSRLPASPDAEFKDAVADDLLGGFEPVAAGNETHSGVYGRRAGQVQPNAPQSGATATDTSSTDGEEQIRPESSRISLASRLSLASLASARSGTSAVRAGLYAEARLSDLIAQHRRHQDVHRRASQPRL